MSDKPRRMTFEEMLEAPDQRCLIFEQPVIDAPKAEPASEIAKRRWFSRLERSSDD